MKRFVLLALPVLLISQLAKAQQLRYGLKAGLNYSTYFKNVGGTSRRFGLNGGAFVRRQLSSDAFWNLQAELLYSAKGVNLGKTNYATGVHDDKVRLHYLDLPILARVHAGQFFFEAGPQLNTILDGNFDFGSPDLEPVFRRRAYATLQLGYAAGVGYELPTGLGLTLRYANDLTGLYARDGFSGTRNSVFQAQLGYLFGAKQ